MFGPRVFDEFKVLSEVTTQPSIAALRTPQRANHFRRSADSADPLVPPRKSLHCAVRRHTHLLSTECY